MKQMMKSVAVVGKQKVDVLESNLPQVLENDILVKVRGTMLCTFEQRIFNGVFNMPLPFVPGHEIVGEVAGIGAAVDPLEYEVGQKVVVKLLYACGECYHCRRGHENLCVKRAKDKNRSELAGMAGLSEYLSVDARQVWKVDNDLDDDRAIFAEPLACVVNSLERGAVELGDDVLVIGGGIMGQLHVMLAKLQGARVFMSEPNPERRKIAEKLGADILVDPTEVDLVDFIKEHTDGYGVEVIFNTTAISEVAEQSLKLMAAHGRNVAYSSQHPDKPFPISVNWIHDVEPVITGAVSPTIRSFNRAVNLLNKRIIDPTRLIDSEFPLEKAQEAFEEAIKPETFRIKINFVK